ncbi:MAG: trehalose-6-phosphate synthase [Gammaproteobacteria bacterium]
MKVAPGQWRSFRVGLIAAGVVALAIGALAWIQVQRERAIDIEDVDRRARALAFQFAGNVGGALDRTDDRLAAAAQARSEGYSRLLGFALYRPSGRILAAGRAVADYTDAIGGQVLEASASGEERAFVLRAHGPPARVFLYPARDGDGILRAYVAVMHDIAYIDDRATRRLVQFTFWILLLLVLVAVAVNGGTWLAYDRPLRKLANWMQRLRLEDAADGPPVGLPEPLLASESDRLGASLRAARSASRERSRAEVRAERVWTRDRLRAHAIDCLGEGRQLVVVSNREPYMHQMQDGLARMIVPAGGLVTALDPVLRACGGLWVAHGAGDADRETADEQGRLTVPPSDGRYTLRRVWLSREEEQGYYYGFSNEGLWPLCHLAHERPEFRASDYGHYVKANRRFADAVVEEIGAGSGLVLVQDYQLALVPAMIKERRPDLCVGIFWHIPWPNPEAFRICPWRADILRGMLGADLIGFHLQQYCNNFLDTVDRMIEARLDWDHFAVELLGHTAAVRPFPISVQGWDERGVADGEALQAQLGTLRRQHGLDVPVVAVGVDRIDYTKGLPERFRAVDRFLEKHPEHRGRFVFVELGAPSRTHLRRYREHLAELEALADEINWKYQTDGWRPLRFLATHHDADTVYAFMRMASVCIVSSLHDGMNLVAKEYVAAREDGVLVLSEFAGAARELSDALVINPYDIEQFADAIRTAVEMPEGERRLRMGRMRRVVEENNIYRWAASFMSELAATRAPATAARPG